MSTSTTPRWRRAEPPRSSWQAGARFDGRYETLILTGEDGLATITLNRPEALNALNQQLKDELADVLRALPGDRDEVRAALLTIVEPLPRTSVISLGSQAGAPSVTTLPASARRDATPRWPGRRPAL